MWALALACGSQQVLAQTTEGYHSDQVFPVVVDSTTFAQRFHFRTQNSSFVTLSVKFFPGDGTVHANTGPVQCNSVAIAPRGTTHYASLRHLCPGLVTGSAFGFLRVRALPSSDGMIDDIPVFAGFSRVSNYAGAGFSVEAFPANTFNTPGGAVVTGIRRRAASANSPAYQTNCFVGNLDEVTPSAVPVPRRIHYRLRGEAAGSLDTTYGQLLLLPGQFVRLLDVFAAAGAPVGDYEDAHAEFWGTWNTEMDDRTNRPGVMTFCTVQDNTSFGADFRIGKLEWGFGRGSNDLSTSRELYSTTDGLGRIFEIDAGSSANTHVVYFKAPDTVQCRLLTAAGSSIPTPGLEMRLLNAKGDLVGGGDGATSTGEIFTGDKSEYYNGLVQRFYVEVESDEVDTGSIRPYGLYCSSGSGNTLPDLIRYKEAVDRF